MQAMEDRGLIVKTSAYIDRHRDEMLSLWEKIVSIESGTPDKEGVDRVGAVLKDELESAGVETAVIPMERFGNLLTGVWHKEAAGQHIVLIGHMDTVFAKGTLEKNLELFRHVQKAADMIGYGKLQTKKVGGWSDSCLAAAEGVPVVCAMGVKGANNHSMEEYAVAETLFSRAKLALASIITF